MNNRVKTVITGFLALFWVGFMSYFVLVINHKEAQPVTAQVDRSFEDMKMDVPALSEDQIEDAYADILNHYEDHTGDINEAFEGPFYYAYVDLVGDGYPECIISIQRNNGYKLIDGFGYDGMTVKRLCTLPSNKVNVKLLKNGLIYEANRIESIKYNAFYQLLPFNNIPQHEITFYTRHSTYWISQDEKEKQEVTKEEYTSKGYPYQSLDVLEDIDWMVIDV